MKITTKLISTIHLFAVTAMSSFAGFGVGVEGNRIWIDQANGVAACDNIEGFLDSAGIGGVRKSDVKKLKITNFAMDYLYKKNLRTDSANRNICADGTFTSILSNYENLECLIIDNVIDEYNGDSRKNFGETTKIAYEGDFYALFQKASKNLTVIIRNINLSKTNLRNVKGSFLSNSGTTVQIMPSGLVSVNISEGKSWTESTIITNLSFFGSASTLTNFSVDRFSVPNASSLEGMFNGCDGLRNFSLADFLAPSATSLKHMFQGCSSLTNFLINSFSTSNSLSFEGMFNECSELRNCKINSLSASKVKRIANMFNGCVKLKTCYIPNFDSGALTDTSFMFNNCAELDSLNFEALNFDNVKNASSMFSGCSRLKNLDLSAKHFKSLTNVSCMFKNCSSLESLKIGTFNLSGVTETENISQIFSGCGVSGNTNVSFGNFVTPSFPATFNSFNGCFSEFGELI